MCTIGLFDALNLLSVTDVFRNIHFQNLFTQFYSPSIQQALSVNHNVRDLGDDLGNIFTSVGVLNNRNNATVSQAGQAWERLCTWYLTASLYGTGYFAVSRNSFSRLLPREIIDTLSISISGKDLKPDIDILVLGLERRHTENQSQSMVSCQISKAKAREALRYLYLREWKFFHLIGVSCKTNFNDQVASALFWDFLYQSSKLTAQLPSFRNVSIGKGDFSVRHLNRDFTIAFFTVPTQKNKAAFKATTAAVVKGSLFSGGCFWGQPKTQHQLDIGQFFNHNSHQLPLPSHNWQAQHFSQAWRV